MTLLRTTIATLAAMLLALPALAHGFKVGTIEVEHPWSRATSDGASNGAVFFQLNNEGKVADRLIAVASPAAAKVELHTHIDDNGVMKMRPINAIALAPESSVTLAPGGLHVMLLGLVEPLHKGTAFPLTLTFEKAGAVTVQVEVQGPGDLKPAHEPMGEHHHHHDDDEHAH